MKRIALTWIAAAFGSVAFASSIEDVTIGSGPNPHHLVEPLGDRRLVIGTMKERAGETEEVQYLNLQRHDDLSLLGDLGDSNLLLAGGNGGIDGKLPNAPALLAALGEPVNKDGGQAGNSGTDRRAEDNRSGSIEWSQWAKCVGWVCGFYLIGVGAGLLIVRKLETQYL